LEYAQSRPYETGDSVKSIDWRTTARTGKVFVKQYESPKQMPTWLAVDDTASMAVAAGGAQAGPTKWQWAVLLAGALGLAALRRTRPVGLLLASGERRAASLSRASLHGWVHDLRRKGTAGRASLGDVVRGHMVGMLNRTNLLVLSDMHDSKLLPALRTCAESHDVAVLRLQDPAELGLTGGGIYRAAEAETGEPFYATGRTRWDEGGTDDELTRSGIDRMTLPTDGTWLAGLRDFLRRRERRRNR
jgi:MYXO-CTERM domain-containing protein